MAVVVPTHTGQITSGAGGRMGCDLELGGKGVPTTISHWLPTTAMGIEFSFEQLRKSAYWGSRHMLNVFAVLKGKGAGNVPHSVFANAIGIPLISALGKEVLVPGIAPDTTTAPVTDVNGLSRLVLANAGGATYPWGPNLLVDTGYTQECVPIVDVVGNGAPGTTIYTKQLLSRTRRTTGLAVALPAQRKVTVRGPLDAAVWESWTMQMEEVFAGQWGWSLNGVRNAKITIRGQREDVEITHNVVVTEIPQPLYPPGTVGASTFTPFNPSTEARAELTQPITIRNHYVIVPNDQRSLGVQSMSKLAEVEDVTLEWDNHTIDKHFANESPLIDSYIGGTSGTFSYKYSTSAGRWDSWEDYIINEFAPPVSAMWRMARNVGTPSSPAWHAVTAVIPTMKISQVQNAAPSNDTMSATVTADIAPVDPLVAPLASVDEPLTFYILDSFPTTLYTAA